MDSEKQLEVITEKKIVSYLDTFNLSSSLTVEEKKQFIQISVAYNLNPFKREVYCIPYMINQKNPSTGKWEKVRKLSIITGYEVYIKRAERLGVLDGWNIKIEKADSDIKAIITIYRKDWKEPFVHDVLLSEYKEEKKMWKEKPVTMIKKVAIAQGFRMCFPDELGGMPYTSDEMPDNMVQERKVEEVKGAPERKTDPKRQPIIDQISEIVKGFTDNDKVVVRGWIEEATTIEKLKRVLISVQEMEKDKKELDKTADKGFEEEIF